MCKYKRIDENIWNEFGQKLLKNKGSKEQRDFLEACRGEKDIFLTYLNEKLFNKENAIIEGETININHELTELQFCSPPEDTQEIIWNTFKDVPYEIKINCGFWGDVIIGLIKSNFISPCYLASSVNGAHNTGIYMIDHAIRSNDEKIIDKCVRRVLNLMGNKAPRSSGRVLFKNFPLGQAYWTWHWSHEMSVHIQGLEQNEILEIIRKIKSFSAFSEKMYSGKSYISQTNILGGLLLFIKDNPNAKLGKIIDKISFVSVWKAIEIQSPEQNKKEIEKIAENL